MCIRDSPEPCYSKAIAPKTRGQDDKVAAGLARMNEEDPSFSVVNNPETRQVVLSGTGDMQLDVLVSRLKSRFGVEAELSPARVPYRAVSYTHLDVYKRQIHSHAGPARFRSHRSPAGPGWPAHCPAGHL